jgi:hypothetical protein
LHVEVKPDYEIIDLGKGGYVDVMGYKISRKSMTMRARDFRCMRRNQKRVESYVVNNAEIPLHEARSFMSRSGTLKHVDCGHYTKKNDIKNLRNKCRKVISERSKANAKNDIYRKTEKGNNHGTGK